MIKLTHSNAVAVNFSISAKVLADSLPNNLVLDYYKGDTFISLICMEIGKVPFLGLPIVPRFYELSLRCFVSLRDDQQRKGIFILKRYASSRLGSWVLGSLLPNLYQPLPIKRNHKNAVDGQAPEIDYQWNVEGNLNRLRVRGRGQITKKESGSKLGFILSHATRFQSIQGRTYCYDVTSPEWALWDAGQANFTCDVRRLFGKQFVKPMGARPVSVFVSPGSQVTLHRPVEI